VRDNRSRPQCLEDGKSPITWFLTSGSVRQQKHVLIYEVLPFLMVQESTGGEILWCPCPEDVEVDDFRQDCLEVIDGYEKMEEFNARYGRSFKMGLAKLWLPRGQDYNKMRVYICQMNAAMDMVSYYYAQCRVLSLGNFTTTTEVNRMGVAIDVDNHSDRTFVAEEYLDRDGYRLKDYCLRTIRQRIRKLFLQEGVEPASWSKDKAKGLVKAPGYKKGTTYRFYDAPMGAPFKEMIRERATIRTEFAMNKAARKNLPILGGFKFGMMNFGSDSVRRLDMSKMARVLPGNGVKEEILSPNYTSFPELAMIRYDQERGENLDMDQVVIPKVMEVRQAAPVVVKKKVMTILVPSWELAGMKAVQEETEKRNQELARLKAIQEEEFERLKSEREEEKRRKKEPTSLAGAVRALNVKNADVRILSKDNKANQGAQQRLRQRSVVRQVETRDRSSSGSSVRYLGERRRSPERERKRGTTFARTSSPKVAVASSVRIGSGEDSSDNEEMDKIRLQRCKINLEIAKLERMEKRYAEMKLQRQ
jgi:hypothetical protein